MAHGTKWLRKQGTVAWIGEAKEVLAQVLWWGTIVNMLMVASTFYFTTLRFVAPWFSVWLFIAVAVAALAVLYVIEQKWVTPSIWAFRSQQMNAHDRQVLDRLDRIEAHLKPKCQPFGVRVAVSGGFDPIHKGHVRHIKAAMELGDWLMVILTSDEMLARKKGRAFMSYEERREILEAILGDRGEVVPNVDEVGLTSCKSIEAYRPDIFAKGGDTWDSDSLPESEVCKRLGIKVVFGVGGYEKVQSSSKLLAGVK